MTPGRYVTNNKTKNSTARKARTDRITVDRFNPVTPATTKRHTLSGGASNPTTMFSTMTSPKWIGSIPATFATARKNFYSQKKLVPFPLHPVKLLHGAIPCPLQRNKTFRIIKQATEVSAYVYVPALGKNMTEGPRKDFDNLKEQIKEWL